MTPEKPVAGDGAATKVRLISFRQGDSRPDRHRRSCADTAVP